MMKESDKLPFVFDADMDHMDDAKWRAFTCQIVRWLGREKEIEAALERLKWAQTKNQLAEAIEVVSAPPRLSGSATVGVIRQWFNAILFGDQCGFKDPRSMP
jgi:hypothetical protein